MGRPLEDCLSCCTSHFQISIYAQSIRLKKIENRRMADFCVTSGHVTLLKNRLTFFLFAVRFSFYFMETPRFEKTPKHQVFWATTLRWRDSPFQFSTYHVSIETTPFSRPHKQNPRQPPSRLKWLSSKTLILRLPRPIRVNSPTTSPSRNPRRMHFTDPITCTISVGAANYTHPPYHTHPDTSISMPQSYTTRLL